MGIESIAFKTFRESHPTWEMGLMCPWRRSCFPNEEFNQYDSTGDKGTRREQESVIHVGGSDATADIKKAKEAHCKLSTVKDCASIIITKNILRSKIGEARPPESHWAPCLPRPKAG